VAPDLTGATIGHFRLVARIGMGRTSVVYRAFAGVGGDQQLAVKVLDTGLTARPGFLERFEQDVGLVAALGHPNILPVHAHGTVEGMAYVAMPLANGGSLKEALRVRPLSIERAWPLIRLLADALHCAHEAGVVHRDVKPGNILFDFAGRPLLADFGLARTNLGFAVGTPAYMAPEQAQGIEPDRRSDVYSLGVVVFEMLTGTALRPEGSPAEQMRSAVDGPIPVASEHGPGLPPALDRVVARALARDPELRYQTAPALVAELAQALEVAEPDAPLATATVVETAATERDFERQKAQLMRLIDNSLTAAIAVDEKSFVVGWNAAAEKTFGWRRDEIMGRLLSTTLIPNRYQEAHERGFQRYLESGQGPVLDTVIEITAMHRGGQEFPIELSISPGARAGPRFLVVGFARDIGQEKLAERVHTAQATVTDALAAGGGLAEAGYRILESLGANLGWSVGVLWMPDESGERLRCAHLWHEGASRPDFERATGETALVRGQGLAGRAWESGEAIWVEDVLHEAGEPRALEAVRGGLRGAIAVPVHSGGEVRAVLEFFAPRPRPEEEELLLRLYDVARRIGRQLAR
jgi:PAS domain S-box-containing protein